MNTLINKRAVKRFTLDASQTRHHKFTRVSEKFVVRIEGGLVAGASVFVCDSLSFYGEIRVTRKHNRFIRRDLVTLV